MNFKGSKCSINGKKYVGQTQQYDIKTRWSALIKFIFSEAKK